MELSQLERYAPQARLDFIQAVTARASKLGISNNEVLEAKKSGDALIIGGNVFPASIDHKRKALVDRVEKDGFDKVMEEAAYTWFNRFTAMRYMEIHGYIEEHPFSLFESTDGSSEPEILKNVTDLNDWKELNFNLALDLKTQNKTEDLYRLILTAQCDSLGKVIPFLFSYHAAETELLLPDGLLLSDSIIKEMISVLNEENLGEVESLGWLYQFYIAEKKDALMKAKKAYKTDEIPAVTQLFTPNWIVKYLTQNSIGRLWLSVYPSSPLKDKMEYYIEPAEQIDEVNKQLANIIPDSLNPEEITVLDPACGSGHILVEAYNLLKEIYLERGYQEKEIPRLILKNNLFGLDIDDRAAQLACFALLMKAREGDRRLFRLRDEIQLNVHAIQETNELNLKDFTALGIDGVEELISAFHDAKTFGSLIKISESLKGKLESITHKVFEVLRSQSFDSELAKQLIPLLNQTLVMGQKYDVVVANPPYLGGGKLGLIFKNYLKKNFPKSKSDLFAAFIENGFNYTDKSGFNALVTMQSWMFLSSFQKMRESILKHKSIITLAHLGAKAFGTISGEVVQTTAFIIQNSKILNNRPIFFRLTEGNELNKKKSLKRGENKYEHVFQDDFKKLPGSPVAYWVSSSIYSSFDSKIQIGNATKKGLSCSGTELFYRLFWEINICKASFSGGGKWYPITKGGPFRKWYGNNEYLINWEKDGFEIKKRKDKLGKQLAVIRNEEYYFNEGASWNDVSTGILSCRYTPPGFIPTDSGPMIYSAENLTLFTCLLNSCVSQPFTKILCPTIHFGVGQISEIPVHVPTVSINGLYNELKNIAKTDWDSKETSWEFLILPWLSLPLKSTTIEKTLTNWQLHCDKQRNRMQELETENNKLFIDVYGLSNELTPDVPVDQITLAKPENESDIKQLLSYAAGCMMGRYSLDKKGLIYAHSKNEGFDTSKYSTFPADDDGIISMSEMEDLMVRDDITTRFTEFLDVVWGKETLSENLKFVADTLGSKTNELPRETIRRWVSTEFFRDHLQRYKNRPIYWLFSSGKKKAFEALVYLHRYNESTLSRMRMKYVVPLQTRISDQLKTIDDDMDSSSGQERTRLTRKKKLLSEKELELREYDETLRHLAEQQIMLDLDDGVKVNYGKFPGLLAETKKVCGE
jgi:type II restriction/modification system DNA methylase subunit YeeA